MPLAAVTRCRQRLGPLEQVERVAVVGDLHDPARALDQAELAGEVGGGPGFWLSRSRRPGRGAGGYAGRRAVLLVLRIGVEHLVVGLGHHVADGRLLYDDDGRPDRRDRLTGTARQRPDRVVVLWRRRRSG